MTFYAITQYIKYRWKAMGRHGTHSPFVYDFIESVIQNSLVIPPQYIISIPGLPLRYENILSRVAARYQYKHIIKQNEVASSTVVDMLLLDVNSPENWLASLSGALAKINEDGMISIIGIHDTRANGTAWKQLCNNPAVTMSIDLYGIGLLLFRKEFKVKQHFVLKNDS